MSKMTRRKKRMIKILRISLAGLARIFPSFPGYTVLSPSPNFLLDKKPHPPILCYLPNVYTSSHPKIMKNKTIRNQKTRRERGEQPSNTNPPSINDIKKVKVTRQSSIINHHQSLLLTPSSLNLTSFNCFPVGFHSSNILNSSSTSLPNSFLTKSSSSNPRIAQGRKNGLTPAPASL